MKTPLINQWFSGHEITAVCWTLIHSLWIGLVVALLCGIVIATTRKSAAALRYRLLCGLLVLFVCAIAVTYYTEASSAPAASAPEHISNLMINAPVNFVVNPVNVISNQTFMGNVQTLLNRNANIIVLVWLLFFVFKSLKMVSGLLYIQRIRRYKTHVVTAELKHKMELFARQIGISQTICLVQSELVKVPVAVGWLKPMILLPLGIILQLTPEQLDGILWHELAHIRRRDYLINILQGLVETVFFFNPGLLWLSSLIRAEREACCDDLVLSQMNKKANYLEALLSFGFGEYKHTGLTMGIGAGNQLRDRLKRIISQENKRLSMAEKAVLAIGLVLLTAFTTISRDSSIIKDLTNKSSNKPGKVVTKTTTEATLVSVHRAPENQQVNYGTTGTGEKDTIAVKDTAILFKSILFKNTDADWANNDISAKDDKGNVYHFIIAGNKLTAMEINNVRVAESKLPDYEYMITRINDELTEKRRVSGEDIARYKSSLPDAKFKGYGSAGKKPYDLNEQKAGAMRARRYAGQGDDRWKEPDARYIKGGDMIKRRMGDSTDYAKDLQKMRSIIAGLVKEKVVASAADVKWFGLSDTEFIVNGRKQPGEMQQRYKAKYGVREGLGLYYGPVQMHGTGVFIDENSDSRGLPPPNSKAMLNGSDTLNWQKGGDMRLKSREQMFRTNRDSLWPADKELTIRQSDLKRRQVFGGEQDKYREQLIRQQQLFAEAQNVKRGQIIKQQGLFVAEQDKGRRQLRRRQQALLAEQGKKRERPQQQNAELQEWKAKHDQFAASKTGPADIFTGVAGDLVSENIVKDKSDLSFNLTNTFFMVNGVKQSDDVHEAFKSKYLAKSKDAFLNQQMINDPNFGLHYDAKNNDMGIGICINKGSPPDTKAGR